MPAPDFVTTSTGCTWRFSDPTELGKLEAAYMECPACGDYCKTLPANPPTEEFPDGWWADGAWVKENEPDWLESEEA